MGCYFCKDLNEEKEQVYVSEVRIESSYYFYGMPIYYCPVCGKKLHRRTEPSFLYMNLDYIIDATE